MAERLQDIHPVDVPQTPEQVIQNAKFEVYRFGQSPIAGAAVHWGVPVSNGSLHDLFQRRGIPFNERTIGAIGFNVRYLYPSNLSMNEIAGIEEVISTQLLMKACEARNIDPRDLAFITVANTFPGSIDRDHKHNDHFASIIASQVGAEAAHKMDIRLACGGFGEGLRQVANRRKPLRGKSFAVASMDGLSKLLRVSPHIGSVNHVVFTNGAVAVVGVGDADMHLEPIRELRVEPDTKGATICGPQLWPSENELRPGEVHITPTSISQRLPSSGDGHAEMYPRGTIRWVGDFVVPTFIECMKELGLTPDYENVLRIIPHIPSNETLNILLSRIARETQIPQDMFSAAQFIHDGNSSSAVLGTNLLRAAAAGYIKPGIRHMVYYFGLGGNAGAVALTIPEAAETSSKIFTIGG